MNEPDKQPRPPREADEERAARLQAQMLDAPMISEAAFRTKSRRAFIVGGSAALAGVFGWRWIWTQRTVDNIPFLLREGHRLNEQLWRGLYDADRLAPTFAVSRSRMPRANGRLGLQSELDLNAWSLRVEGPDGALLDTLGLADIQALPPVEMTTELKCIEGWSEIVHWTGARFSDFAAKYLDRLPASLGYVGLATPDREYYVGMDMASMLHAQTLLCYAMQGAPLTMIHGAPLRLVTPLKYGVKNLKRIGVIRFSAERPADYWAERGYDWYIGH